MLNDDGYLHIPRESCVGLLGLRDVRAAAFSLLVEQGHAAPITMPHRNSGAIFEIMRQVNPGEFLGLGSELFFMPPGAPGFLPHQDNYYIEAEPAGALVSLWIPLVDVTPERGCLRVWPGSHLYGRRAVHVLDPEGALGRTAACSLPGTIESVDLPMRAGDGVLLHGDLVHSSNDNRTGKYRPALLFTYIRAGAGYRAGNRQRREAFAL